jgi:hypothetical protein
VPRLEYSADRSVICSSTRDISRTLPCYGLGTARNIQHGRFLSHRGGRFPRLLGLPSLMLGPDFIPISVDPSFSPLRSSNTCLSHSAGTKSLHRLQAASSTGHATVVPITRVPQTPCGVVIRILRGANREEMKGKQCVAFGKTCCLREPFLRQFSTPSINFLP